MKAREAPSAFGGQDEVYCRLSRSASRADARIAQVMSATAETRETSTSCRHVFAAGSRCSGRASARCRQAGRRCRPARPPARLGKRPAVHRLPDFQHGRRLHDLFHARRIVHARQLHQNLVLAQSVLLDDRLAHAQLVNAVANGLDRLRNRTILQFRQAAAASSSETQEFSAPEVASYSGRRSLHDAAQIARSPPAARP